MHANRLWHQIKIVGGFLLIGLGVLGLLLPLMPGIPLIVAGVALVGVNHPWVRPLVERVREWKRRVTRR